MGDARGRGARPNVGNASLAATVGGSGRPRLHLQIDRRLSSATKKLLRHVPRMAEVQGKTIVERGAQMFPRLTDDELARLSRFGEPRRYRAGETVARVGEVPPGLQVIVSGRLEITQHDAEEAVHIVTHEHGNFTGELAQLSGRPSLVDAIALTELKTIVIPPDRLRGLLIAEADLGERIMR